MHDRSKKPVDDEIEAARLGGEYAPLRLPEDFPVSKPHHVARSSQNAIKAHIHECFEIGYCHEGGGIFLIGDKMLHFGPGDAVAVRAGDLHLLIAPQDSSTRWSFVNLDAAGLLAGSLRELGDLNDAPLSSDNFMNLLRASEHPDVCLLVKSIVDELDGEREGCKRAVAALVWALFVKLRRLAGPGGNGVSLPLRSFDKLERLRPAVRLMADEFSKELSVAKLARLCGCSQANFRRYFHDCFGVSPRDYLLRLRVEVAKSLLMSSSRSILEISLRAGFPSLSNFNRQFRRFVKLSPREFRRGERRN